MTKVFETKCQVCGQEFKGSRAAGALALHLYKKHGVQSTKKQEKQDGDSKNWRFLDPNDPMERRAIDAGYEMISCDEGKAKHEQRLK